MDLTPLTNSAIGFITPYIVSGIKKHLLPWSGKAAYWLSLIVTTACVTVSYVVYCTQTGTPQNWNDYLANVGLAFTMSQTLYAHISDGLKG